MTPSEEILRRRRSRQPMDETLPDGTPAMEIGMRGYPLGSVVDRMRGIASPSAQSVGAQPIPTSQNQSAITRPRRAISDPRDPSTFQVPPGYGKPEFGRRHGMTPEQAAEFLKKEEATIY